jgi:hypothetical protein
MLCRTGGESRTKVTDKEVCMSHDIDSLDEHTTPAPKTGGRSFMGPIKNAVRLFGPSLLVGLVAPFVFPAARRALAPVAKGLIKGGVLFTESLKEAATDVRDRINDALAEVKAEQDRDTKDSASANKK